MNAAPLACADELAARAVARSELPSVDASSVDAAGRADVRALVLSAGSVEVLRRWRREGFEGPAVIVAADAGVVEERAALEPVAWAPADGDLRSTLSRFAKGAAAPRLRLGPVEIDLERRRVSGARSERLTALEAKVLGYLAARRGRVVSRDELLTEVWGYEARNTNTVPVMVGRIRKKIEVNPKKPLWLLTCRGDGYRLVHGPSTPKDPGLVGRQGLLRELLSRLERDGRVWLTGWPGGGRTRLARTALSGRHVLRLELGEVVDVQGVRAAAAAALGRRLPDEATLVAALARFEAILADDADDLEPAALELLLDAAPSLVGVSLRAPVGVGDALAVPPLPRAAGVELLRQRLATEGVVLSDAVAAALVDAVDGLPLALELLLGTVKALGGRAALGALDVALPDAVGRALATVVERLDPAARSALACLAGLPELDTGRALQLAGVDPSVLAQLVDAGVVRVPRPGRVSVPSLLARHLAAPPEVDLVERMAAYVHDAVAALPTPRGEEALRQLGDLSPWLEARWDHHAHGGRWLEALLALDAAHRSWRERQTRAHQGVERLRGTPSEAEACLLLARVWEARDPEETRRWAETAAQGLEGPEKARALYLAARAAGRSGDAGGAAALAAAARSIADPALRRQLDAYDALRGYEAGSVSEEELVDHNLAASQRLLELGRPAEAARELVYGVGKLRLIDAPRAMEAVQSLRPHLDGVVAPRSRLWLTVVEAELVHEVHGDLGGAMALLEEAEGLALRFEPSHVAVVDGTRGTLLWDAGKLREARRALQRNLSRERHSGTDLSVLSVLLDLIGVELGVGDVEAARRWERQARRVVSERWVHYLEFESASIELVAGDWALGLERLDALREATFNPACGVSLGVRALAACRALGRDDRPWRAWLAGALETSRGRLAVDARALLDFLDGGAAPGPFRSGLAELDRGLVAAALV